MLLEMRLHIEAAAPRKREHDGASVRVHVTGCRKGRELHLHDAAMRGQVERAAQPVHPRRAPMGVDCERSLEIGNFSIGAVIPNSTS